jgi:hypothetical protein
VVTPELEETLRKSKGETSAVLQCLQYFYDHNTKTYVLDTRRQSTSKVNCRLSWLTALPVGSQEIDTESFKAAFGENASHGTASRILFGFAETRIDPRQSRNWSVPYDFNHFDTTVNNDGGMDGVINETVIHDSLVAQIRKHKVTGFAPGVEHQFETWDPGTDLSGRDFQHLHKVCILTAIIQGHSLMEQSDWDFTVAFMKWQRAIRLMFSTGRARQMKQAEFNETVMEHMYAATRKLIARGKGDKYTKIVEENGHPSHYVLWSKLSNANRWYKYGMNETKTIEQLVTGSHLQYWSETEYDAQGKETGITEHKAWVKVVNFAQLEKSK